MTDNLDHVQRELLNCLATCHAISEVHGQFIGDPLDIKMFEYTKWVKKVFLGYLFQEIGRAQR
jgi:magnesium-transporting ATPase (P-type)